MSDERVLSQRELEQLELDRERAQAAVDAVDHSWPDICAAVAVAKDCHTALVKQAGVPDTLAWSLVPAIMRYLK